MLCLLPTLLLAWMCSLPPVSANEYKDLTLYAHVYWDTNAVRNSLGRGQVHGSPQPAQAMPTTPKFPAYKRPKDPSLVTVEGHLGEPSPLGQKMQFWGRWRQHAKHGLQLACFESRLLQDDPINRALADITGQIPGVGRATAEALVKTFGADIVQVELPGFLWN